MAQQGRRFNELEDGSDFLVGLPERHESALCLFFGTEDENTGESWCPDCVVACPVVRRLCRELRPELPLYEFPVGTLMIWKYARFIHPYKGIRSINVQFVPTLLRESRQLMRAQTIRCGTVASHGITRRAVSYMRLLVPIFVSAIRRADELSVAMEARGYRLPPSRRAADGGEREMHA